MANKLAKSITELTETCSSYKETVQPHLGCHKRNRKTLQHHLQLLELLELPQLVDACIRNGFIDEAIDLANFVNGLERRHLLATEVKSTESKDRVLENVMGNIVNDVHLHLVDLRQELMIQLTENNHLPKLIQIMATLRKLDGLFIDRRLNLQRFEKSDTQLTDDEREDLRVSYMSSAFIKNEMDFLEARTVWMERLLNDSHVRSRNFETDYNETRSVSLGLYGSAIEMLELRRTCLFAIISQFNALFEHTGDADHSLEITNQQHVFTVEFVLQSWLSRQITELMNTLRLTMRLVDDAASIRAIVEQCLFLSARLGDLGGDFTPMVLSLMEESLEMKLKCEFDLAVQNFIAILSNERIIYHGQECSDGNKREQIIPLYTTHDWDMTTSVELSSSDKEIPYPQILLKFPPLSFLLNAIISLLNFLRECPLCSLHESSLDMLFSVFMTVGRHIVDNFADIRMRGSKYFGDGFMTNLGVRIESKLYGLGSHQGKSNPTSNVVVDKYDQLLVEAFLFDLVPHVVLCHEGIFAIIQYPTVVALHSKLPSSSAGKLKHLWSLIGEGIFSASTMSRLKDLQLMFVDAKLIDLHI